MNPPTLARLTIAALALLWGGVVPAAAAARRDRIVESVPVQAGRPVHVRVTVGRVVIRAEDRRDIAVEIDREVADTAPADALPVRVEAEQDAVRVSALQPGQARDPAATARVVVSLPPETPVLVDVGEGGCEVSGTRGPLQARVDRGPITLSRTSGVIRAETTTGDIVVRDAELPPSGQLRLRVMTGDVTIGLASRPTDARLLLLALSGRVSSTEPLQDRGGPGRRLKEAVIGQGRASLSVDVVRGDITVTMP